MSKRSRQVNGQLAGLSKTAVLQADLVKLRAILAKQHQTIIMLHAAGAKAETEGHTATTLLATLMHKEGIATVTLTDEDKREAWNATWLRVHP